MQRDVLLVVFPNQREPTGKAWKNHSYHSCVLFVSKREMVLHCEMCLFASASVEGGTQEGKA